MSQTHETSPPEKTAVSANRTPPAGSRRPKATIILKAGQAATRVVRACVKDAKAAALASEAKSYYTVIKYDTKDGQAKELSRETFGQKE